MSSKSSSRQPQSKFQPKAPLELRIRAKNYTITIRRGATLDCSWDSARTMAHGPGSRPQSSKSSSFLSSRGGRGGWSSKSSRGGLFGGDGTAGGVTGAAGTGLMRPDATFAGDGSTTTHSS